MPGTQHYYSAKYVGILYMDYGSYFKHRNSPTVKGSAYLVIALTFESPVVVYVPPGLTLKCIHSAQRFCACYGSQKNKDYLAMLH